MKQIELKVLWIEDEVSSWNSLKDTARIMEDIILEPYKCWDDALPVFQDHFEEYAAIILDAKCKYHRSDEDNATKFLSHVITDIQSICAKKNHQIHWYVLTGGDEKIGDVDIRSLINEVRTNWDGDWEFEELNKEQRPYYKKKSAEIKRLFSRIRDHVSLYPQTHIKVFLYPDVFEAIKKLRLNPEVAGIMANLLLSIHYPSNEDKDYNNLAPNIRKVLEYIFRALIEEWSLLPSELIDDKDIVNMDYSCRLLQGLPAGLFEGNQFVLDEVSGKNIYYMKKTTNGRIHTKSNKYTISDGDASRHIELTKNYYLFQSYAIQLCDLILYLKGRIVVQKNVND